MQPCRSRSAGPSPPMSRRKNSPRPGTWTIRPGGGSIGGAGASRGPRCRRSSAGSDRARVPAPPAAAPSPSLGEVHRARLADDRDLDLAGVLELLLDLACDVARERDRGVVVDVVRGDDHADLAARLHRVDLVDAGVAGGDVLEVTQALDVLLERLAASAGAGAAERVGGLDDHGLDR